VLPCGEGLDEYVHPCGVAGRLRPARPSAVVRRVLTLADERSEACGEGLERPSQTLRPGCAHGLVHRLPGGGGLGARERARRDEEQGLHVEVQRKSSILGQLATDPPSLGRCAGPELHPAAREQGRRRAVPGRGSNELSGGVGAPLGDEQNGAGRGETTREPGRRYLPGHLPGGGIGFVEHRKRA
jgi:hypothetical protein